MSDFLPVTWHIFLAIFVLTCILVLVLIKYSLKPISDQNVYLLQENSMELKGRVTIYSIVGCPHCMKVGLLTFFSIFDINCPKQQYSFCDIHDVQLCNSAIHKAASSLVTDHSQKTHWQEQPPEAIPPLMASGL